MKWCVCIAIAACGKDAPSPSPSPSPAAPGDKPWTCEPLPFAVSTPVPEASAAAWWKLDGKDRLVVVGDSGRHGAYGIIDPETGETGEQGKLPLGDGGDDLEGLSAFGGRLYGLTSSGWMRVWERRGDTFALVDGPYAIGEGDMICGKDRSNCARDYEGLCLHRDTNGGACAGYVASRTDGTLYCLALGDDHLFHVDRARAIPIVARKGVVADCTYDDADNLWVGNNLFGLSQVYRIEHDKPVPIAQIGTGFPEVIAVRAASDAAQTDLMTRGRGDIIWRMSDAGGAPSLMSKFRCSPPAR